MPLCGHPHRWALDSFQLVTLPKYPRELGLVSSSVVGRRPSPEVPGLDYLGTLMYRTAVIKVPFTKAAQPIGPPADGVEGEVPISSPSTHTDQSF